MISFLAGSVKQKSETSATILVGGVGYESVLTPSFLANLRESEQVEVHVYTHVREDCLALYGFKTTEELDLFKMFVNHVSGIGPKTAMLILDRGVTNVKKAIICADVDFFTLIPRLGKKNSQKIIIELKNKIGGLSDLNLADTVGENEELIEALLVMGYTRMEISESLKYLPKEKLSTQAKLKIILKDKKNDV